MKQLLQLTNVGFNYHTSSGETMALREINITVNEGEFVAIVGPSGCGKTTILSLMSGLIKPSSGQVLINGLPAEQQRNKLGYMFQRDHLFTWRTIWQNIMLGLEIKKDKTKQNKDYAEELLKKYGLYEFKDKQPNELSGGMRQRVALIRTIAVKPQILLLDEPFSALDFQTRQNVCNDVSRIIAGEKKTAVLVTHDLSEAVSMADRIIVLSARPARVKKEFLIDLKAEGSPLKRRESLRFRGYFEAIWKELDTNEEE